MRLQPRTCRIGSFETEKVREIVEIPKDIAIIELMAFGYPADGQRETNGEPLEKILCYEKWQF